jgi:hypothetical protein
MAMPTDHRLTGTPAVEAPDWEAIMAVLVTSTPPVEGPDGHRCGTKPREFHPLRDTVIALGIAAAAFLVAWGLHGNTSSTYRIDSQWGAFAGLFILALAIERALEPFSRKLGPDTTEAKKTRDSALAHAPTMHHRRKIAAEHQGRVDMSRRLTAIVTWGVATGFSFILCAQLNITLMHAVRASNSGAPPFWADLLVTGLVVGAGTKPLHDLVSNIERDKHGPSPD